MGPASWGSGEGTQACGRGLCGLFSVLSFSTNEVDQVSSPSGALGTPAHHFPLSSSSSMAVDSGLWSAEL